MRRALTIQDTSKVNTGTWKKLCGIAVPQRQLLPQMGVAGASINQAPSAL
jgi:hypothetical protein